ncbi:histidine phosphatase family protein [Ectobacillus polymachus]|uniref:histidine phosphatase family protein n=1 Tax=Ectobacillus polymachus TaxID=1508806 RepID=UPI003A87CC22
MEISLIRHGKSKHIDNNRVTCKEFKDWIKKYDDSGVLEESSYPLATVEKLETSKLVITSDLKRTTETVRLLNPNVKAISSPLFRETELPVPSTKLWNLKLKPSIWAVILRCLWFSGYAKQCESLSNAKQRAKKAAEELVNYAKEHESVALVGHGFINMLIAKELQGRGWKGKRTPSSKHLNCTTYSFVLNHGPS